MYIFIKMFLFPSTSSYDHNGFSLMKSSSCLMENHKKYITIFCINQCIIYLSLYLNFVNICTIRLLRGFNSERPLCERVHRDKYCQLTYFYRQVRTCALLRDVSEVGIWELLLLLYGHCIITVSQVESVSLASRRVTS